MLVLVLVLVLVMILLRMTVWIFVPIGIRRFFLSPRKELPW